MHGFADSGLAYKEVFDSPLNDGFNIYIVDLPGFGASPINPNCLSIHQQAELLSTIISNETTQQREVNLVAHSLGGLIGTWLCQSLGDKINYFFNIEGNLTEADSYFSSKPLSFQDAEEFFNSFEQEIFELAKSQERYRRYYSSLRFTNAEGMRNWSISSQEHITGNKCGHEFIDLTCNKLYIWGDCDTPDETQEFIKTHKIPNRLYKGVGHWHMVENANRLYRDFYDLLKKSDSN